MIDGSLGSLADELAALQRVRTSHPVIMTIEHNIHVMRIKYRHERGLHRLVGA